MHQFCCWWLLECRLLEWKQTDHETPIDSYTNLRTKWPWPFDLTFLAWLASVMACICTISVIIARAVFLLGCGQTDRQTDSAESNTHAPMWVMHWDSQLAISGLHYSSDVTGRCSSDWSNATLCRHFQLSFVGALWTENGHSDQRRLRHKGAAV